MEAPIKTRYDKAGPQVAEALRRRRFEAHYVSTAQEALDLALTLIPKDRTVSWGGTATAAQIEEISKKIEVLGGKVELAMKKLAE